MKQILLNVGLLATVALFLPADLEAAGNSLNSACEVTNPNNDGLGTLRDCLQGAQQGDVITFNAAVFPPSSPTTVLLTTELPVLISGNVTIDAHDVGVILDGNNAVDNGLTIQSDDNRIFGLEITRFSMYGIYIDVPPNVPLELVSRETLKPRKDLYSHPGDALRYGVGAILRYNQRPALGKLNWRDLPTSPVAELEDIRARITGIEGPWSTSWPIF